MGLINWLRRKRESKAALLQEELELEPSVDTGLESIDKMIRSSTEKPQILRPENKKEREAFVNSCCEQMGEAQKVLTSTKIEYQNVTAYLADIQEIENLPKRQRAEISEAARNIVLLDAERKKMQKKEQHMSDSRFWHISKYEEEFPDSVKRLKENEDYLNQVKSDMRYLESEKTSLLFERREIRQNQANLKGISIIALLTCLITCALLVVLQVTAQMEVQFGYFLTVIAAAAAAGMIFFKMRQNDYQQKKAEVNLNKAIALLNKVKIKFINTKNAVDYAYEKYQVKSAKELNVLWERYILMLAERERYSRNTSDLDFYNEELIKALRQYRLTDPGIWIHQAEALIEPKEMVEIRHELNAQRQKLRERMEYNQGIIADGQENMDYLIEQYPEYEKEIRNMIYCFQHIG